MAERVNYEIATCAPTPDQLGRWWYHAECAEHGWNTDHNLFWETAAFDANAHAEAKGCQPVMLRLRATPGFRPPIVQRPTLRRPAAGEQQFWAQCAACAWGTRPSRTRLRSHRFADEHHKKTGHAVDVLTRSGVNVRAVTPILTQHHTGVRQESMF